MNVFAKEQASADYRLRAKKIWKILIKNVLRISLLIDHLIGRWEENLDVFTLAFQDLIFVKFSLNPPKPKRHLIAFRSVVHLLFCSRTCSLTSTLYIS